MSIQSQAVQSVGDGTGGTTFVSNNLVWTPAGGAGVYTLGNGIANISWSHGLNVYDSDQVVLHCSDTWGGDVFTRSILVAWHTEFPSGNPPRPQGTIASADLNGQWFYDTTSTPAVGAQFTDYANTINRWTLSVNANLSMNIQIPVQAFRMAIGVYSNGVAVAPSATTIYVTRLRVGDPGYNQGA